MMHQNDFTKHNPISKKTKYRSLPLFQSGQDLPLFTQSPDRVTLDQPEKPADLSPGYSQLSLFGEVGNE